MTPAQQVRIEAALVVAILVVLVAIAVSVDRCHRKGLQAVRGILWVACVPRQ